MNERNSQTTLMEERRSLSPEEVRSRENMKRLGREYHESAERLRERIAFLREMIKVMTPGERKVVEARIALLEQELRECHRTGNEAGSFYLPGHRFLPKPKKRGVWPGSYLC